MEQGRGAVVYGLIRHEPGLPPPKAQTEALEREGAGILIQDEEGFESEQRVRRLLSRLQPGDELVVYDIGTLGQGEEMLSNLRLVLDRDARVRLAAVGVTLEADTSIASLLDVVRTQQEHDAQRTSSRGGSRNPLSSYQVSYARRLQRQGCSLREIGLLFQVTPREVARMLATY